MSPTTVNGFPTGESMPENVEILGYIGLKGVKSAIPESTFVIVTFVDNTTTRLHGHVYDMILSETPMESDITELISHCLAKELLKTLTEYDICSVTVDHVAQRMMNLVRNAHDAATNILWGNKTVDKVTLQDVDNVLKNEIAKQTQTIK